MKESRKERLLQIRRRHALRHVGCKICKKTPCCCDPSTLRKHRIPEIDPYLELPRRLRK
jgi:hypothetical protein